MSATNDMLDVDKESVVYVGIEPVPGQAFYHYMSGETFVRFCFAKEDGVLDKACCRLKKPVRNIRTMWVDFLDPRNIMNLLKHPSMTIPSNGSGICDMRTCCSEKGAGAHEAVR